MLTVDDVHLYYGASHALRGVSLEASKGRVTCVLGRNGVGKTSLLRAILGLEPVRSGRIVWEDRALDAKAPYERARAGIGNVPQGREIFARLSVQENLRTGFAAAPRDQRAVPAEVFELFPVLKDMLRRRGGDLSGGQQQQLAIARALVMRPAPAAARRADRGHPALDHQADWRGDLPPSGARRDGHPAGRAVPRLRAEGSRRSARHGPGTGRGRRREGRRGRGRGSPVSDRVDPVVLPGILLSAPRDAAPMRTGARPNR
jgi:ABC-type ATPase involved in cell division